MFKVLCIVDKELTAIDRLSQGMVSYNGNIDYQILAVHPKRPDTETLADFEALAKEADIIDAQYFKSALMLIERYPWLKDKKKILTHHNPYSITESNWNDFDVVVGNNEYIYKKLQEITQSPVEYIPNTVDTSFWTFKREYEPKRQVLMVANRIEGKKGIYEAALASKKAGLDFALVGNVSDADYFYKVLSVGNVTFHQNVSNEALRELYWESMIHVCNSQDNFESGTLPMLEAMLCGTPVITRNIGHVPELNNDTNMIVNSHSFEDVDHLSTLISELANNPEKQKELRNNAWESAKIRSDERRAWLYQKLYRKLQSEEIPVSVILPIYNNPEVIRECIEAVKNQTYKNIELVICDDSDEGWHEAIDVPFPLRYIYTGKGDYGLARARNMGIIEATGEVIVFCDQRVVMAPDAIEQFISNLSPSKWLYGNKGKKKEFVENFSCIYRQEIIDLGMFCERIDLYGGMSQEIRTRAKRRGIRLEYIETAKASQIGSSKNKHSKKDQIIKMKNRLFKMNLME